MTLKNKYLPGEKYGQLTIIKEANPHILPNGHAVRQVECCCDCGNNRIVNVKELHRNPNITCGKKMCDPQRIYHPKESSARIVYGTVYNDGDLTFEKFYELSQKDCYYCGTPPSNIYNDRKKRKFFNKKDDFLIEDYDFIYNGLDRIDSSKPHTRDNVVPCCFKCNWMKSDLTVEDFKNHIDKIYNHLLLLNTRTG